MVVKEVPLPGGMLSDFSRKMSSLFFGGGGVASSQETRGVVLSEGGVVLVLTSTHLQHWKHTNGKIEVMLELLIEVM